MSQTILGMDKGVVREWTFPDHDAEVIPGVKWGYADSVFSPAYWAHQLELASERFVQHCFLTGETLFEETVFCLLGGHGISYELNLAAFEHLRGTRLLAGDEVEVREIADALRQPLRFGARTVKYRFPNKRAEFIHAAHAAFATSQPPGDAIALRSWLVRLPGIGPKTASWIVRNWLDSDNVAIIDVHLHRAGVLAGLFDAGDRVERDYYRMERRFLAFAAALGVRPSALDGLIWAQMRQMPVVVSCALDETGSVQATQATPPRRQSNSRHLAI